MMLRAPMERPDRDSAPADAAPPWLRRPISVTIYALLFTLFIPSTVLLVPVLGLYDFVARRRWASVRVVLFFATYLTAEILGILTATGLWLIGFLPPFWSWKRYVGLHIALQRVWVAVLFLAVRLLWGIRVEIRIGCEHSLGST